MKIAYIEIAGFRGVKNRLRIEVPSGFLVLVGRNGTGKSTICDAIEYALTGSIREHGHKEKGETYADYLWWRGSVAAQERFVQIGFVDADGASHVVTRNPEGLDRGSQQSLEHLYSKAGAPDRPLVALANTALLRDEEITALSVDLPESERYKFVRDALGSVFVSDLDERLEEIRKRVTERHRKELQQYEKLRDKVSDVTARLSNVRATYATASDNSSVEAEMRQLLKMPTSSLSELLDTARKSLAQERLRVDRLHQLFEAVQQLQELQRIVESSDFTSRQSSLQEAKLALERSANEFTIQLEELQRQIEAKKHDDPIRAQHAELCDLGESLGLQSGKCPLCGSGLEEQQYSNRIESVRLEIQKAAAGIVSLLEKQRLVASEQEEKLKQLSIVQKQVDEQAVRKLQFDNMMREVNRDAASLELNFSGNRIDSEQVLAVIEKYRTNTRRIESGIGWLESSSVTEMIASLEAELNEAKKQSNESFAATTKFEKASGKIKDAQKLSKSLLGEIIDEQLAELSPLIEELYRRLRPHVEWTHIRYRLRGDVRRMLSFEVGEGLNPSFVFSSGQRRAAGLAFLLAVHLSRPWCRFNTLILDDPVQHVDDFRALNLTEVLTAIRKTGRQIICCVEDEALGRLMCRRLRSGTESDGCLIAMKYGCEEGVMLSSEESIGPNRQHILVPA
jgi:chromosome segregation protein